MSYTATSQPTKVENSLRDYSIQDDDNANPSDKISKRVVETYYRNHTNQTMETVLNKKKKWLTLNRSEMTIMEALELLNSITDSSDPDVDVPNIYHAFQTAERIRQKHPDKDWFILTGLIHDIGKLLIAWGEEQWAVVGDTFPVGCAFSDTCVYSQFFSDNVDSSDERYNSQYGIYRKECGLDNVHFSFGHDEYLYSVLVQNGCSLPAEALFIIRYHSFYPGHTEGAYTYLYSSLDHEYMAWIKEFNQFDLYSKADALPNVDELKPYYEVLINKFCPGKLRW